MQHNGIVLVRWVPFMAAIAVAAACGPAPARPPRSPVRSVPVPVVIAEVIPEPEPEWVKHDPKPRKPPPISPGEQKPYEPKSGEQTVKRETLNGHKKPPPAATLPEEVVVKLMDAGRLGFIRCFKKAVANDPSTVSFKVRLHVELDGSGTITVAHAETPDDALAACLVRIANMLPYPAPGKAVLVELPLFYRAE